MVRIGKAKIIKKELASTLSRYGFEYEGYKNKSWHFKRVIDEITQEIVILEYRFDASYFTFLMVGLRSVTASMLDESEKFLNEYWKAENEEEFEALMKFFLKLIVSKGLSLLEEASKETDRDKIKKLVSKKAFEDREQIYATYISKHPKLKIEAFTVENIDMWFNVFQEECSFYKRDSIEKLTSKEIDEYIEVVVFIGMMLEKHLCGVWEKYESGNEYTFIINDMNAYRKSINLVNVFAISIDKNEMFAVKAKISKLCE